MSDNPARVDEQILIDVAMGRAVLFLGAGFALAPFAEQGERDKGGLRAHLLREFDAAVEDATLNVQNMAMEDIVLYLETRGGIGRALIEESLRRFLGDSKDLSHLESFTLLRTLFERRRDVFDTIITTNWDSGVETALGGLVNTRLSVVSDDHHALPNDREATLLLKIHGDISPHGGPLVISSADFDLFEFVHPRTVERLRSIFASRYLLVMGYSAQDENFRRIVRHVHYDLGNRFQGGAIVTPHLADREKLWINEAGFRHIPATADQFLRELLQFSTTDAWGTSSRTRRKVDQSAKGKRLTRSSELESLARELRQRFALRHTWVIQPRTLRDDTNARVDFALAYVIESLAANAKSLALSTGRTVEYAAQQLDPDSFRHRLSLYSTVIVLNSNGGYRDPSALVDVAAAVLGRSKARVRVLRASGLDDLLGQGGELSELTDLAQRLLEQALAADVIVGSVRPGDWYGQQGLTDVPRGRTLPFTDVFDASPSKVARALATAGVVGIHQMVPLTATGEDATSALTSILGDPIATIVRPGVEELGRSAASSSQQVVLAASHVRKAPGVLATLRGGLCNSLVVDAPLARVLLSDVSDISHAIS